MCDARSSKLLTSADRPSTGRSPGSRGQQTNSFVADILRGVDIPVMGSAALEASPMPNLQGHLVANVPARGARLAGWEPTVGSDERLAFAHALALDEVCQ